MKIVDRHFLFGPLSDQANNALVEIENTILTSEIIINPTPKGNGVKPIKNDVVRSLIEKGWELEHPMQLEMMRAKPLDAFKSFDDYKVGFEWETGNISSSFRALMKLIKGLDEDQIDLGVHVVPSREFYNYLTDRVGNIRELLPYLNIFGKITLPPNRKLALIVVEYDALDKNVKLIPKGKDGMSLKRRGIKSE